jgi:hypothetical protein
LSEHPIRSRSNKRRKIRQDLIDWRRSIVIEGISKGKTQSEIAGLLSVGIGTVNRDISWFRAQARENITKFVEKIQVEHEKSMIGIDAILRQSRDLSEKAKDNREKLQALSLAKECYALKENFICNAPVIDEALKFVENKTEVNKPNEASGYDPNSISEAGRMGKVKGDKEYDIQRSEKKDREGEVRKTTNKTF